MQYFISNLTILYHTIRQHYITTDNAELMSMICKIEPVISKKSSSK